MEKFGTVYWITGLAGSGKTTIGNFLHKRLRKDNKFVVFLDGDKLREVFGKEIGYSLEERKRLALSYSKLCKILSDQGVDVICATISLFKEVHRYNKQNLKYYYEIFVECDMPELISRDQKGIYSKALRGQAKNVMGVDLPYERPEGCSLIINNTTKASLDEKVERILNIKIRRK